MDFSCPNCGNSLDKIRPKAVPLPGARRFLPLKTGAACPACNQMIEISLHPIEKRVRTADALAVLTGLTLSLLLNERIILYAAMSLSGMVEIGVWWWARRYLRSWKRYAPVELG